MFRTYLGVDPLTGKQKHTTRRGFKSVKEAKLALSRLEVEVAENGFNSSPDNPTYQDLFDLWFDHSYKESVKESTYWNTSNIFRKHILPVLGDLKIKKIDVIFCQKLANQWAETSPKRYLRYINYAGMVFKYAISLSTIVSNPMSNIITPTIQEESKEGREENFYDREELLDFLNKMEAYSSQKVYMLFHLLCYTGLRKGEALALTWRDLDLKRMTLTVNKTLAVGYKGRLLVQVPKTKSSMRTISLDANTIHLLRDWKKQQKDNLVMLGHTEENTIDLDQLVFSDDTNQLHQPRTPIHWLDTFYRNNRMNKKITVHGTRHTHASLLFEAGASLKQVQERLGHANIKTTMNVYAHVTKEAKEETALLFADYMENKESLSQKLSQKDTSH